MNEISDRNAGPAIDPNERPGSEGKRWAILLGFAALAALAVISVDHNNDAPAAPQVGTAAAPGAAAIKPTTTQPRQGG